MRNVENTFVNELVAGVGRRQTLAQEDEDEVEVGDAPSPVVHRALGRPIAASPVEPASPRRLYERAAQRDHEQLVPTFQMRRTSEVQTVVNRFVLPIVVLVSTGVVIGSYVAFGGAASSGALAGAMAASRPAVVAPAAVEAAAPAPAPVEVAAAAPAPVVAPAISEIPVPVAPALVDVRIESTPSGATVMLVDRGRTQLVGDTPVDAAVDPAREYDLVFTYAGGPPRVEHLDPAATRRISVSLGQREPAPHRARSRKR